MGTVSFCEQINRMFDALNRKIPRQGVTPASKDFRVLQESLLWLNNWENNVKTRAVEECHFLTQNTAQGLRITLHSAMDLCLYMSEKYNFTYLLTGKINQDPLEVYSLKFSYLYKKL